MKNSIIAGNIEWAENIDGCKVGGDILGNKIVPEEEWSETEGYINKIFNTNRIVKNSTANTIIADEITNCEANIIEGTIIKNNLIRERIEGYTIKNTRNDIAEMQILGNKASDLDGYNIEIDATWYNNKKNNIYGYEIYDITDDEATHIYFNQINTNNTIKNQYIKINKMLNLKTIDINNEQESINLDISEVNKLQSINEDKNNILKIRGITLNNVANDENGLKLDFSQNNYLYNYYTNEYFDYEWLIDALHMTIVDTNVRDLNLTNIKKSINYASMGGVNYNRSSTRIFETKNNLDKGIEPKEASKLMSIYDNRIKPVDMYSTVDIVRNSIDTKYMDLNLFDEDQKDYYGYDYSCEFMDFIRNLPNLKTLKINGEIEVETLNLDMALKSRIENYEKYNCKLANLETLDLSETTGLKEVKVKDLENLKTIKLSNNIEKLTIENLQALETLDLSEITGLKEVKVKDLENLRTIKLSNNIEKLTIENLPALEILDLSESTELKEIKIKNLPKLKTIQLSNSIEVLDIEDLSALEALNLSELISLRKLYLKNLNIIEEIKLYSFKEENYAYATNLTEIVLEKLPGLTKMEFFNEEDFWNSRTRYN